MTRLLPVAVLLLVIATSLVSIKNSLFGHTPVNLVNLRQALSYLVAPLPEPELASSKYLDFVLSHDQPIATDVAIFDNKQINASLAKIPTQEELASLPEQAVLGDQANSGQKWIEIVLSEQKVYAWEGSKKIYEFVVSTGRQWTPTPEGEFRIWAKLKATRMKGGSVEKGDYYDLPNVPYVMFFNKGYGLHGTYWHNNFGTPMSHGCVNLKIADAKTLFEWTTPALPNGKWTINSTRDNAGTRVVVRS